ncbi:unnamed protein product [Pleuronectes platessa]|uniref:Uncharacterized protein n=1 Tax=Pleuronectes platessa TaxID=8262 RepID=A0A9N7VR89_PLEPL|nr:unnamed protein product [Pleuronectes platessa]
MSSGHGHAPVVLSSSLAGWGQGQPRVLGAAPATPPRRCSSSDFELREGAPAKRSSFLKAPHPESLHGDRLLLGDSLVQKQERAWGEVSGYLGSSLVGNPERTKRKQTDD